MLVIDFLFTLIQRGWYGLSTKKQVANDTDVLVNDPWPRVVDLNRLTLVKVNGLSSCSDKLWQTVISSMRSLRFFPTKGVRLYRPYSKGIPSQ